ncbi:DUF4913 domain-containing protein [Rathayibacter sp. AY1C7]|uniref:DUF4913 domain-containing protein n=1 Tax=Rathayibacter sp. AY1C7 TaxID=2080540 RepID=UPI001C6666E4
MTAYDFDPFGGEDSAPTAEHAPAPGEEAVTTHYGSADEFVRKQLISTYRRRVIAYGSGGGMRWKAAWWESKEAVQRIEALWRAWEAARRDETDGPSTWWVNHCDPHMNVLLSMDGPFADSRRERRRRSAALHAAAGRHVRGRQPTPALHRSGGGAGGDGLSPRQQRRGASDWMLPFFAWRASACETAAAHSTEPAQGTQSTVGQTSDNLPYVS